MIGARASDIRGSLPKDDQLEQFLHSMDSIPKYDDDGDGIPVHGGRRNWKWEEAAVDVLIDVVKANHGRLRGKEEIKGAVWKDIAQKIQHAAPGMTPKQVEIKWKNIRMRYFKARGYREMESRARCPEYFKKLDTFLPTAPPRDRGHGNTYKTSLESSRICSQKTTNNKDNNYRLFVNGSGVDSPPLGLNNIKEEDLETEDSNCLVLSEEDSDHFSIRESHSFYNSSFQSPLSHDEINGDDQPNNNGEAIPVALNLAHMVECQVEGEEATPVTQKGKKDIILWNNKGTGALIHLVKENYTKLTRKEVRSSRIWREIGHKLQSVVPGVTHEQARIKWKNVRAHYLKFKYRRTTRTKIPPYYGVLSSFVCVKPTPKTIVYNPELLLENGSFSGRKTSSSSFGGNSTSSDTLYLQAEHLQRLRLEEHLVKSERVSHDLLQETRKSNKLLEILIERFDTWVQNNSTNKGQG